MPTVTLATLVHYSDRLLRTPEFDDWEGAANGLQVENRGTVTRLAAAVDASLASVEQAIAAGADLLLVHHGLFWGGSQPWTGARYRLLRLLLDHNLAVYSSHLPLDAHPNLGNNARLCAALGARRLKPFFISHGRKIGFQFRARLARGELAERLRQAVGHTPLVLGWGPVVCRRIGVVSGAAGAELKQAADEGVDTLITGEGPHWTFTQAQELGLNLLYGGHYATEALGIQAFTEHLARRFRLPWSFLDLPSGL